MRGKWLVWKRKSVPRCSLQGYPPPVSLHPISSASLEPSIWCSLLLASVQLLQPLVRLLAYSRRPINAHLINGCYLSGLVPQRGALFLKGCPQIPISKTAWYICWNADSRSTPQIHWITIFGDHPRICFFFFLAKFTKRFLSSLQWEGLSGGLSLMMLFPSGS